MTTTHPGYIPYRNDSKLRTGYIKPGGGAVARARAALELRRRRRESITSIPEGYEEWLKAFFPQAFSSGFAEHHHEFWRWVDSVGQGSVTRGLIFVLGRGGGKTTNVEAAIVRLAARRRIRFGLYVRATQTKANESISTIAGLLERSAIEHQYPGLGNRLVGKYGQAKAWNMSQLRTSSGFSLVGLGLDVAARGAKIDDARPDFIVFDDVDDREDSELMVAKKKRVITESILPTGSTDVHVVFAQNVMHSGSLMASLCGASKTGADFLLDRKVIGPVEVIEGLRYDIVPDEATGGYKYEITEGKPTWSGQDIETAQAQMNLWGLKAFMREAQHVVSTPPDNVLWSQDVIDVNRVNTLPGNLSIVVVGVDPHGTTGKTGIIVAGIGFVGYGSKRTQHAYILGDYTSSEGASPEEWASQVVAAASSHSANAIVAEINFGGQMVASVIRAAEGGDRVKVVMVSASRGKVLRAEPVSELYDRGLVHHLGIFPELEYQMTHWQPGKPSPNRIDALVWAITHLFPNRIKTGRHSLRTQRRYAKRR